MIIIFDGKDRIEWEEGSHLANIYKRDSGTPYDGFSFSWEKNVPDKVDFYNALASHMLYLEVTEGIDA